ncbi:hypothetical protein D3C84_690230 [compost metagenome]
MGVECLAFAGIEGHHRATHGRIDSRVAQFGFVAAQASLGLADLCLEHVDAGLGGAQLGFGALHVFFAGCAAAGQLVLALQFLPGQVMQGALLLQLGLEGLDGIAPGVELGLLRGRVDFHQQLPFLDRVADFDMNLVDLP